jgi:hypothetical protein
VVAGGALDHGTKVRLAQAQKEWVRKNATLRSRP